MTRRRTSLADIAKPRIVVPEEHEEQKRYVRTLQLTLPLMYEHMTAIPNGGQRHKAVAGKLKAEGVKPGYPDILIDLPRGPFHGLRIEMKRTKRSASSIQPSQREWGARLNDQRILTVVGRGCDHAMEQSIAYWNLGEFTADEVTLDMSVFEVLTQ